MKKKTASIFLRLVLFVFIVSIFSNCKKDNNGSNNNIAPNVPVYGSFSDTRDGYVYKTVKIGNQTWFAENLRYLPNVVGKNTMSKTEPLYYVYDFDGTDVNAAKKTYNFITYGVLYNRVAACSSCPSGWHLPSFSEFLDLTYNSAGNLKSTGTIDDNSGLWESPNYQATNSTGFSAIPGGCLDSSYNGSTFNSINSLAHFWTDSICSLHNANYGAYIAHDGYYMWIEFCYRRGMSVRCIKD